MYILKNIHMYMRLWIHWFLMLIVVKLKLKLRMYAYVCAYMYICAYKEKYIHTLR